jgi:hypothetical protein
MRMISRIRTAVFVAALCMAVALPGAAVAKHNNGLHCGKGHAKHARAIGKACGKGHAKHHHRHGHDRDD